MFLLACINTGTVTLSSDDTAVAADADTDADTDTDTDSDADSDSDADTDVPSVDGTWSGSYTIEIWFEDWNWGDSCVSTEEVFIQVENGHYQAWGGCWFQWDDGGLWVETSSEGVVSAEGKAEGVGWTYANDRTDESDAVGGFGGGKGELAGKEAMRVWDRRMDYVWTFDVTK